MTNRRELADRLEMYGRSADIHDAARLLREPVAKEVLELLTIAREQAARAADKAGCDGWRAQEICRQIVPLLNKSLSILRARLDDEGKGLPEPPEGPVA